MALARSSFLRLPAEITCPARPLALWYLDVIALPGAPVFARVVPVAELAAGTALILGVRVRLAGAASSLTGTFVGGQWEDTGLALTPDGMTLAFVDGELSAERDAQLRGELREDPNLRAQLATLERVDSALRSFQLREAPAGLLPELKAKLRAEEPQRARTRLVLLRSAGGVLAAAAAVVLYLAVTTDTARIEPASIAAADGFAEISDEDIGIAFEYETLENIEVLENLEALELLLAQDDRRT